MSYRIVQTNIPTSQDRDAILAVLSAHNERAAGPSGYVPYVLLIRGEGGETVGGLWGRVFYSWLLVELLAVPEQLRGQKIGTQLMRKAEAFGRKHKCVGILLDTFSFQARGFYEKLGFEVFAELKESSTRRPALLHAAKAVSRRISRLAHLGNAD